MSFVEEEDALVVFGTKSVPVLCEDLLNRKSQQILDIKEPSLLLLQFLLFLTTTKIEVTTYSFYTSGR